MFNAIVVDDEAMARLNVVDALKSQSNWQCAGQCSSGEGVAELVNRVKPNLVFLDIKMPGASGLAVARELADLHHPPLIVFITAYDEHALSAFELYAIDYLLKPFSNERFNQCIERIESLLTGHLSMQDSIANQTAYLRRAPLTKLVIKSASHLRVIDVATIRWFAGCGNYLEVHHAEGKHLLRSSMKQIIASLPADDFVQIHRSYIVRIDMVRELISLPDDKYSVVLSTNETIPVGRLFKADLIKRIYE